MAEKIAEDAEDAEEEEEVAVAAESGYSVGSCSGQTDSQDNETGKSSFCIHQPSL